MVVFLITKGFTVWSRQGSVLEPILFTFRSPLALFPFSLPQAKSVIENINVNEQVSK